MPNSEEIKKNTKVPETDILGKCTVLGVKGRGIKEKHRINNRRIYMKGHVEEFTKSKETQNRLMVVMGVG